MPVGHGRVLSGFDVVQAIEAVPVVDGETPTTRIEIIRARVDTSGR